MPASAPDLTELGWNRFFAEQIREEEQAALVPVRVMSAHRGKIGVAGAGGAELISPHMANAEGPEGHPAVGDWLLIDIQTRVPARILERASLFKRRAPGHDRRLQLIAANVDTLFIVASCNEDFNLARLERYLVLAREARVQPVIVLTKADLATAPEGFAEQARGLATQLPVQVVNARDPASVAALAAWCGPGQTVALLGSSGVGKSTLVNTMRGSDSIATQPVRADDGKGRHTTTVREIHRLAQGGWLMDTPGMRELQLTDVAGGLAMVFADIGELAKSCQFTDCVHDQEPGCAVQGAIAGGQLDPARLDRMRRLAEEDRVNSAAPGEWIAPEKPVGEPGRPNRRRR